MPFKKNCMQHNMGAKDKETEIKGTESVCAKESE